MNSTSPSTRFDSIAARSPARSRAGPLVMPHGGAELGADDHREAGLAQAGRPGEQHVVRRVAAAPARPEHEVELLAHPRLADELGEPARAAACSRGRLAVVGRGRQRPLEVAEIVLAHRARPSTGRARPRRTPTTPWCAAELAQHRVHRLLRGLGGEAQADAAPRRPGRAACRRDRRPGGVPASAARRRRDLVAQLDDQPLGALAPDARARHQRGRGCRRPGRGSARPGRAPRASPARAAGRRR